MNSGALCVPCGSDIAIALHTLPHRAVSLALVAQALGATQEKGQLARSIESIAKTSFSEFSSSRGRSMASFSLPKSRSMASFSLPRGRIGSRKKVIKAVNVEVSTPTTPTSKTTRNPSPRRASTPPSSSSSS